MVWGKTDIQKRKERGRKDASWFAWYPVKIVDGRWFWWGRIKREYWVSRGGNSGYDYELI